MRKSQGLRVRVIGKKKNRLGGGERLREEEIRRVENKEEN